MSINAKQRLSINEINQIQGLIQSNIDSRDGFRHAASATDDLTLQSAFVQVANEREAQAAELATFVAWSGESPREEGSVGAALQRALMTIRESLSFDDRYAILCEAERCEDMIKAAYESAMVAISGSVMDDVLLRQYRAVTATHDRIRDLRDAVAGE